MGFGIYAPLQCIYGPSKHPPLLGWQSTCSNYIVLLLVVFGDGVGLGGSKKRDTVHHGDALQGCNLSHSNPKVPSKWVHGDRFAKNRCSDRTIHQGTTDLLSFAPIQKGGARCCIGGFEKRLQEE